MCERLEREIAILRAIRPYVTTATPDPVYTSFAEKALGNVFIGYPLIPGEPLRPTLIHGDFGTGNILYDPATQALTGVIDFDGAGVGDPAVDLAAVPTTTPAFFEGFAVAYPDVTNVSERVDFYSGTFALQEALFGLEQGDPEAFQRGIAPFV